MEKMVKCHMALVDVVLIVTGRAQKSEFLTEKGESLGSLTWCLNFYLSKDNSDPSFVL